MDQEDPGTGQELDEGPEPGALGCDLLAWWRAVGVEDVTGEEPVDWLARGDASPGSSFRLDVGSASGSASVPAHGAAASAPALPPSRSAAPGEPRQRPEPPGGVARPGPRPEAGGTVVPAQRQFAAASPDAAVMAARTSAREAATLDDLKVRLDAFSGCALKATAKNLCFFRGAGKARLMIIGEAPGRDEDLSGLPFVGPAGRLLDRMLAAIGLSEADVHITNTVYWRPPGNRTPSPQETQACRPFLDRQIELVEPAIIALLGGAAVNTVLGVQGGIMRLRGSWKEIEAGGRRIKVMPSLHPAYLLRTPSAKRQAWRDMLAIAEVLDGGAGG